MPSLKEVRTRIESVNSTKQITSAMKMVAAAKLRKSQQAIGTMRPYATKLKEMMQQIVGGLPAGFTLPQAEQREGGKVLVIPVTSNRGLCGTFNTNVIRTAAKLISDELSAHQQNNQLELMCIGRKGDEFFKNRKYPVTATHNNLLDKLNYESVAALADHLMESFLNGTYDKIVFVYSQFKSASSQMVVVEQFLPIQLPVVDESKQKATIEYLFEPDGAQILNELVPKTLRTQVFKVILDSLASENGARMIAMHKATDNATEMLRHLKLSYNKARQAAITKEILEIVAGANALK
ncbi:MAG: ATP synthase F1 subunit gamma [Bacteroidetes bacterium]|nr:ATP synthase F1 subunit gamma [Bacteroidota bacterium]